MMDPHDRTMMMIVLVGLSPLGQSPHKGEIKRGRMSNSEPEDENEEDDEGNSGTPGH
jgi:hypothetical protein